MRDDSERLHDIIEAIAQIQKYSIRGKDAFQKEELIQVWIVHHLQIIGEASNSLSGSFIAQHSNVPWTKIIAFRNIIVHEYFRVDLNTVWKIIEQDLTYLQHQVKLILENIQNQK